MPAISKIELCRYLVANAPRSAIVTETFRLVESWVLNSQLVHLFRTRRVYQSPGSVASVQIDNSAEIIIKGYVDIETAGDPI